MPVGATRFLAAVALGAALVGAPVRGDEASPLVPSTGEKCPVCGMFVARYPDWIAIAGGAVAFSRLRM
jgi:copper chaperone NosL